MKYLIYGVLRGAGISTCQLTFVSFVLYLETGGLDLGMFRFISVCCCLTGPCVLIIAELRDVSGPKHPYLNIRIEQKPENMACLVCGFLSALSTPIMYLKLVEGISPGETQVFVRVLGLLLFWGFVFLHCLCKRARARVLRDCNCGRYGKLTN